MLFTDLKAASQEIDRASVVIGNFDGVHIGHRALIRLALSNASSPVVVLTFDPHPVQFFRGGSTPFLLTSIPERSSLLHDAGASHVVALTFDQNFASLTDEEFVQNVLLDGLHADAVMVGTNFVFGKGRMGNFDRLSEMGEQLGFDAIGLDPVHCEGERASSTRVRAAIRCGDMALARTLLGRNYSISGEVVHGEARGRTLGFPTANVEIPKDRILPPSGIYAATATVNGESYDAATYIGTKPTFDYPHLVVETFVLDPPASFDIYGEMLQVSFESQIRKDVAFTTVEALIDQMNDDIVAIREFFQNNRR